MIKANIYGNLGADAELKVSGKGKAFLKFSVGTQVGDNTQWVNCVVFTQDVIDFNKDKLVKGARVQVYGNLKMDITDKGSYLSLVALDIVSVYSKNAAANNPRTSTAKVSGSTGGDVADEDVPFLNTERE
jgi:single-stranded DNA-binding protein